MEKSGLKRCPFCGGKAERTDCVACGFIQIKCSECDANVTMVVTARSDMELEECELAHRWNRRVSDD